MLSMTKRLTLILFLLFTFWATENKAQMPEGISVPDTRVTSYVLMER